MKRSKLAQFKPLAVVAVGVLVGRGAQAQNTILTFDSFPAGQGNNAIINPGFGSNASTSSAGVSVTGGGTPDISLTWGFTAVAGGGGGGGNNVEFDYYIAGPWSGAQLNNSGVNNTGAGTAAHTISLTPLPSVAVQLNSFKFHGYYNSTETFDYTWSVMDGVSTLASGNYSFTSDGTKNHLVNIGYTGGFGESLSLNILRTGGSGGAFNIAIDDFNFTEVASVPEPSAFALMATGVAGLALRARARRKQKLAD